MKRPQGAVDLAKVYPTWYLCQSILGTVEPFDFSCRRKMKLREDAQEEVDETTSWLAPLLAHYLSLACMGELRHGTNFPRVKSTLARWGAISLPISCDPPPVKPNTAHPPIEPPNCEKPNCSQCEENKKAYDKLLAEFKKANKNEAALLEAWEAEMDKWHVKTGVEKEGFNYATFLSKLNSQSFTVNYSGRSSCQDFAPSDPLRLEWFYHEAMLGFSKKNGWSGSFGGTRWYEIARAGWMYLSGGMVTGLSGKDGWGQRVCRTSKNAEVFVDHVAQLRHNGGVMFDKRGEVLHWNNERATANLLLDLKRDARDAQDIARKLTSDWSLVASDKRLQRWIRRVDAVFRKQPAELAEEVGSGVKFQVSDVSVDVDTEPLIVVEEEGLQSSRAA